MGWALRVDVAPLKHFIILAAVSFVIWLFFVILSATSPDLIVVNDYYAYQCPGNSHVWNVSCTGVQLSTHVWSNYYTINTTRLNKVWYLLLTPYAKEIPPDSFTGELKFEVKLIVELEGWNEDRWVPVGGTSIVDDTDILCFSDSLECDQFVLIYEDVISYVSYRTRIKFDPSYNASFVGDVEFTLMTVDPRFSDTLIPIKIICIVFSIILLIVFLVSQRRMGRFALWEWEQRATLILLIGLICFNNPLFPFEYIRNSWFFILLGSVLELAFDCCIFLFWLFSIEKIRDDDTTMRLDLKNFPKLAVVFVYAVLAFVLYTWATVREKLVPVWSISNNVTGIQVIFYMVVLMFIGIVFWFVILLALAVHVVSKREYLRPRFLFLSIPTSVAIMSLLVGVFNGAVGPFGRETDLTIYYLGLFNLYGAILVWGYWPISTGFSSTRTEETQGFGGVPKKTYSQHDF